MVVFCIISTAVRSADISKGRALMDLGSFVDKFWLQYSDFGD